MPMPAEKGVLYRHYKGNVYEVVAVAKHSETLEELVIYKDTSDESKVWARPASMWNETVILDGKRVRRFERIPRN